MAGRGLDADTGLNRNINMGFPTSQERHIERSTFLTFSPGENDAHAPDEPGGEVGKCYFWDEDLRRG